MTRPDSSAPQMARGHVAQDTPFALIIAVGCVAAFALSWPLMVKVWTDGLSVDTDDAMRMVQVRDWLAGQGWYDLRALRLDPPAGTLMHWSRVVDLPLQRSQSGVFALSWLAIHRITKESPLYGVSHAQLTAANVQFAAQLGGIDGMGDALGMK